MKQLIFPLSTIKRSLWLLPLLFGLMINNEDTAVAEPQTYHVSCNQDPVVELQTRIASANSNEGEDIIVMDENCFISLSSPMNSGVTETAFTIITDDLIIEANGSTLKRSDNAGPQFRLLESDRDVAITIRNLTIEGGYTESGGGGIYATGDLTLQNVFFRNNISEGDGGGAYVGGDATIINSQFNQNDALNNHDGGGLYSSGTVAVWDSSFIDNTARIGGGLYSRGKLTAVGTEFINNGANVSGGAHSANHALVMDSEFRSNYALLSTGGGLGTDRSMQLFRNVFFDNSAILDGGGANASFGDGSQIINNIFQQNDSTEADGNQLALNTNLFAGGIVTVQHNTFDGRPRLGSGSGIFINKGVGIIENNIIVGEDLAINPQDATVEVSHNLFFDNTFNFSLDKALVQTGNMTGDPLFVSNADLRLKADSPARDSGKELDIIMDMDHVLRVSEGIPDRGAFEFSEGHQTYVLDCPIDNIGSIEVLGVVFERALASEEHNSIRIIDEGCLFEFTTPEIVRDRDNNSAMTIVSTPLTIEGNNALFRRHESAIPFRIFESTAPLTLLDLTVQNGRVGEASDIIDGTLNGGGIYADADLTLNNVKLIDNETVSYGGGAYVSGHLTMQQSNVENNKAFRGGFAAVDGTVQLSRSIISGNEGGGLDLFAFSGSSSIFNNLWLDNKGVSILIFHNVASDAPIPDVQIYFNTFAGSNTADDKAVLLSGQGNEQYDLLGNIFTAVTVGVEGDDATVSATTNLYFDNEINEIDIDQSTDIIEADPLFVNPTEGDFSLQPDSPAIDRLVTQNQILTVDLNGRLRPQGKGFDLGAYEASPDGGAGEDGYKIFLPLIQK